MPSQGPPSSDDIAIVDQQVPSKVSIFLVPIATHGCIFVLCAWTSLLIFTGFFPISCEAFSDELRCSISGTVHAVSSENDTQIPRKKTKAKENDTQSLTIFQVARS